MATHTQLSWLWPGRIPIGCVSRLVGAGGAGKSLMACELAAHVSTGAPWPDGTPCPQGQVVMMFTDDDPEMTVAPRLRVAGADVREVLQCPSRCWCDQPIASAVAQALEGAPHCRLLVVDPVSGYDFGPDGTRAHIPLLALRELAAHHQVALVLVDECSWPVLSQAVSQAASATTAVTGRVGGARAFATAHRNRFESPLGPIAFNITPDRNRVRIQWMGASNPQSKGPPWTR